MSKQDNFYTFKLKLQHETEIASFPILVVGQLNKSRDIIAHSRRQKYLKMDPKQDLHDAFTSADLLMTRTKQ